MASATADLLATFSAYLADSAGLREGEVDDSVRTVVDSARGSGATWDARLRLERGAKDLTTQIRSEHTQFVQAKKRLVQLVNENFVTGRRIEEMSTQLHQRKVEGDDSYKLVIALRACMSKPESASCEIVPDKFKGVCEEVAKLAAVSREVPRLKKENQDLRYNLQETIERHAKELGQMQVLQEEGKRSHVVDSEPYAHKVTQDMEEEQANKKGRIQELEREVSKLRADAGGLKKQVGKLNAQNAGLQKEIERKDAELKELNAENEQAAIREDTIQKEHAEALEKLKDEHAEELEVLRTTLERQHRAEVGKMTDDSIKQSETKVQTQVFGMGPTEESEVPQKEFDAERKANSAEPEKPAEERDDKENTTQKQDADLEKARSQPAVAGIVERLKAMKAELELLREIQRKLQDEIGYSAAARIDQISNAVRRLKQQCSDFSREADRLRPFEVQTQLCIWIVSSILPVSPADKDTPLPTILELLKTQWEKMLSKLHSPNPLEETCEQLEEKVAELRTQCESCKREAEKATMRGEQGVAKSEESIREMEALKKYSQDMKSGMDAMKKRDEIKYRKLMEENEKLSKSAEEMSQALLKARAVETERAMDKLTKDNFELEDKVDALGKQLAEANEHLSEEAARVEELNAYIGATKDAAEKLYKQLNGDKLPKTQKVPKILEQVAQNVEVLRNERKKAPADGEEKKQPDPQLVQLEADLRLAREDLAKAQTDKLTVDRELAKLKESDKGSMETMNKLTDKLMKAEEDMEQCENTVKTVTEERNKLVEESQQLDMTVAQCRDIVNETIVLTKAVPEKTQKLDKLCFQLKKEVGRIVSK